MLNYLKTNQHNNLTKSLGAIFNTQNVSNSCYDDEYYTPCKVPDYNKAYSTVIAQTTISKEDLETTCKMKDKEEGVDSKFSLKDLLKLVVIGDFGDQYKTTSSRVLNFEAILHLISLTSKNLTPENNENLWTEKKEILPEARRELKGKEYQKARLGARSFGELVGRHFDFFSPANKEEIELAYKVARKLENNKEFKKEITQSFRSNGCEYLLKSAETQMEKEVITKEVKDAALHVKNKSYDKLARITHYDLRRISLKSLFFGETHDPYFDNLIKSLKSIENNISKGDKTLDIEM